MGNLAGEGWPEAPALEKGPPLWKKVPRPWEACSLPSPPAALVTADGAPVGKVVMEVSHPGITWRV